MNVAILEIKKGDVNRFKEIFETSKQSHRIEQIEFLNCDNDFQLIRIYHSNLNKLVYFIAKLENQIEYNIIQIISK